MHDTGKLHPTFLTILHPKSLKEINMELTIIETSAYQDLKKQLSMLSVQMMDFQKKIAPVTPDKWLDAQDVCLALNISKRALQTYRDNADSLF